MLTGMILCMPAVAGLDTLTFHPVPLAKVTSPVPASQLPLTDTAASAVTQMQQSAQSTQQAMQQHEAAIAEALANKGPYQMSISEHALALGHLQQEQGDLRAALDSFERSMHVLRVNLGLYSLEQVPVMKAIINTHVELGDVTSAHAMQEALFNLQLEHHGQDDLAVVPALIEWADWNVNLYLLQDSRPSGMLTAEAGQLPSRLRDPGLDQAYTSYTSALRNLQRRANASDERLVTTERKLAALNFMINRKMQDTYGGVVNYDALSFTQEFNSPGQILEEASSAHFYDGSSALRRAIAYSYDAPELRYDYIAARMMELGDWYLLFDRRAAALDIYQDALRMMLAVSLTQEEVERIMSPGMPVLEPDAGYLGTTTDNAHFAGFIDVEFDLSRFGMATNPQIIGSSTSNRKIEKELLRTIRSCKFRPKFVAGSAVNDEKVQLRYYYSL
jgi:hypothetical protein